MSFQTGKNVVIAYKVESVLGTKPGTGGAKVFRASPSSGLELKKAPVSPSEFRSDGMTVQARHGSRMVDGGYDADLSVGTFDELLEAVLRGTWTASVTFTFASVTSIVTSTSVITAIGSVHGQGVRVGDIIRLTGHSQAANNGKNLRVVAMTDSTITVPAGELVADATPDTTGSITVLKRLIQATTPRSFTFDEYFQDIDKSQVFKGVRITSMTLKFQPDATVMVTFGCVGQDMEVLEGGSAPYYISPTISTSTPLVLVDGKLRVNGVDVVEFTSFEVTFDLSGATQPTLGSLVSPDVFTNPAKVSATMSMLREDFDNLNAFIGETTFEIHVLCVEPESEPKDCIAFYFSSCKFMANTKGIGQDNALIETAPVDIGKWPATDNFHLTTMIQISTSAA